MLKLRQRPKSMRSLRKNIMEVCIISFSYFYLSQINLLFNFFAGQTVRYEIDIKIREKTIDKKECIFCVFIEEGNMIF